MDIIGICINTIKKDFPNVTGIWLFGSAACGTATVNSDIDLAIFLPQKTDQIELWRCAQSIASKVNKEIDLVDLLDASTVLRTQIMQEGKLVYFADKFKCDMFETEALTNYLHFSDERKELLEDIKSRGRVLGNNG